MWEIIALIMVIWILGCMIGSLCGSEFCVWGMLIGVGVLASGAFIVAMVGLVLKIC